MLGTLAALTSCWFGRLALDTIRYEALRSMCSAPNEDPKRLAFIRLCHPTDVKFACGSPSLSLTHVATLHSTTSTVPTQLQRFPRCLPLETHPSLLASFLLEGEFGEVAVAASWSSWRSRLLVCVEFLACKRISLFSFHRNCTME